MSERSVESLIALMAEKRPPVLLIRTDGGAWNDKWQKWTAKADDSERREDLKLPSYSHSGNDDVDMWRCQESKM